jgi:S1-C subfamily serine protease
MSAKGGAAHIFTRRVLPWVMGMLLLTACGGIAAPTAAIPSGQAANAVAINQRTRPAIVQVTGALQLRDISGAIQNEVPAGVGTGFIYDPKGLLITNDHVISGASSLTVTLADERTLEASVVGEAPDYDLAVLQIKGGDTFPTVPLGDSSKLQIGQPVVAIGNALGLRGGPTVTMGVVSATGRTVQAPPSGQQPGPVLTDMVQTDAAINPGNSGGPLFDAQGRVIGINTLGAARAEGINFAIAINQGMDIAKELVANGKIVRPYVGLNVVDLNAAVARSLGVDVPGGVAVARVAQNSPASQAGIMQNDVIVAIDGKAIQDGIDFQAALKGKRPGDTMTFAILRGPQKSDIKVTLGQPPV